MPTETETAHTVTDEGESINSQNDSSAGLPSAAFARFDNSPDEEFYDTPRFVTHIDEAAIGYVTNLYRQLIPANGSVLDLMSSWVSHLPPETAYQRVVGLGMNRMELAANPRLDERVVQNLNVNGRLPFNDDEFEAALICVSIQYLSAPVEVLREAGRVLREGAPVIITFSNRCFPTKAVAVWQALNDVGHLALVESYLHQAARFIDIGHYVKPVARYQDPLYAVIGRKKPAATG